MAIGIYFAECLILVCAIVDTESPLLQTFTDRHIRPAIVHFIRFDRGYILNLFKFKTIYIQDTACCGYSQWLHFGGKRNRTVRRKNGFMTQS